MARELTSENFWIIVSVALVLLVAIAVVAILAYFGPSGIFELFQGIMSAIAYYLILSIHSILR